MTGIISMLRDRQEQMPAAVPLPLPEGQRRGPLPRDNVVDFLNMYDELRERCTQLEQLLVHRDAELRQANDRISLLDDDLNRATLAKEAYQRAFFEIQAQLSVLAATSVSTCEQVGKTVDASIKQIASTAMRALQAAKDAMLRDNLDHDGSALAKKQKMMDAIDDGVREIGAKFGANSRPDNDDVVAAEAPDYLRRNEAANNG